MSTTTRAALAFTLPCTDLSPTTEQEALAWSAAFVSLWGGTGGRIGLMTTVGEQFRVTGCQTTGMPVPHLLDSGNWTQTACGGGCCKLLLRNRPLRSVTEVRVNGTSVAFTESAGIVTLTGGCPVCDQCGDDPIEVDYVWGVGYPDGAEAALGELACEFVRGLTGGNCRLSARAVSIARQGVQIDMADATELLTAGFTGLPMADAFIRAMNPGRLTQPSRVYSPDLPMGR